MKYTIERGTERPLSDKISDNLRYLFPLVLILIGALYFGLHQNGNNHKVQKPLTLGIYTVNTTDDNSGNSNPSSSGNNSEANSEGTQLTPQTTIPSSQIAPSSPGSAVNVTGLAPGGSGSGDAVTNTTVSCVDKLTNTTLVCVFPYAACTPPLAPTLQGVKTVDGTCIIVN